MTFISCANLIYRSAVPTLRSVVVKIRYLNFHTQSPVFCLHTNMKKPFERLPKTVVPVNYQVVLKPDLKECVFDGKTVIQLEVRNVHEVIFAPSSTYIFLITRAYLLLKRIFSQLIHKNQFVTLDCAVHNLVLLHVLFY